MSSVRTSRKRVRRKSEKSSKLSRIEKQFVDQDLLEDASAALTSSETDSVTPIQDSNSRTNVVAKRNESISQKEGNDITTSGEDTLNLLDDLIAGNLNKNRMEDLNSIDSSDTALIDDASLSDESKGSTPKSGGLSVRKDLMPENTTQDPFNALTNMVNFNSTYPNPVNKDIIENVACVEQKQDIKPVEIKPIKSNLPPNIEICSMPSTSNANSTAANSVNLPPQIEIRNTTPRQSFNISPDIQIVSPNTVVTPSTSFQSNIANRPGLEIVRPTPSKQPRLSAPSPPATTQKILGNGVTITTTAKKPAVSITPTKPNVATIDLTDDTPTRPTPTVSLNNSVAIRRPQNRSQMSITCSICDKSFLTREALNDHMKRMHRQGPVQQGPTQNIPRMYAPSRSGTHKCDVCGACYSLLAALEKHKDLYQHHVNRQTNNMPPPNNGPNSWGIPIVEISNPQDQRRLNSLGVRFVVPIPQMSSSSGVGFVYGLPLIPVNGPHNPGVVNIGGLGATNILPLGTIKKI